MKRSASPFVFDPVSDAYDPRQLLVAGRTALRDQLHQMIEFESLWDDREFEELIRPRD